jgi:uncharacterized membrane protein
MHAECVVAEYESVSGVQTALEVLERFDFSDDAVSVVSRSSDEGRAQLREELEQEDEIPPTPAGKAARLGTLIGGSIATPFSVMSMVGPFIVAGPLAGMAAGAAVGGLLGGTTEWGVSGKAADEYEQRVKEGSMLVLVNSTPDRLTEAERGLKTTSPKSLKRFKDGEEASKDMA